MKKIQSAFEQAMEAIAKELGLKKEDLNLWIKCDSKNVNILARDQHKVIKLIPLQKMIGSKMLGLRIGMEQLGQFFKCVHAAYISTEKPLNPDAVSLVMYISKLANEICIGVSENNKAKKSYRLSELTRITRTGYEREGELN